MKKYGDKRRVLGIAHMIIWGIICVFGIWTVGHKEWEFIWDLLSRSTPLLILSVFTLLYILVSFPFDLIGGFILPQKYGRSLISFIRWLGIWARAAGIHGLYYLLNGYMLYIMGDWLGLAGAVLWVIIQMILLGNLQVWVARALVRFKTKPENDRGRLVLYLDNQDKAFTGGIAGFPGNEVIVMPHYWRERFSEDVVSMLLTRRHGVVMTGNHGRGFLLAVLSNAVLFGLAAWLGEIAAGTIESTICTILWYTLFSFTHVIGLLPWLSRRSVWEIDRWAYFKGADADVLRKSIKLTDQLQNPSSYSEKLLPHLTESLPDAESRIARLQQQAAIKGAWHTARLALFLSWAGVGLLSRAVPSNTGRPELWVFLASD